MAGIKRAMKRVMEHKNIGKIVAKGVLQLCDCDNTEKCSQCGVCQISYIIIQLDHDNGMITEYDTGSDVRFQPHLKLGDKVILMITDNWTAEWKINKTNQNI